GAVMLFREAEKSMIEPHEYRAVEVGRSEAHVRAQLPSGDSFLMDGLDKGAPPEPAGAECVTYRSTEVADDWDKEPVFRFCFKDGRLIEKKSCEVTWEWARARPAPTVRAGGPVGRYRPGRRDPGSWMMSRCSQEWPSRTARESRDQGSRDR